MLSARDMFKLATSLKDPYEMAAQAILNDIFVSIKLAADEGNLHILSEIPRLVEGVPNFNYQKCDKKVKDTLIAQGFKVTVVKNSANLIKISWKFEEDDKEVTVLFS